jgi:branched-chain amino acid aminotransferase
MHRFVLHNDDVREAGERVVSAGQVGFLNGWGVFTTIRVYDGVLFAWERHFARMSADAHKMRVPFPDRPEWLEQRLRRLVEANQAWNATLRVAVLRNRGGLFEGPGITREFDLIAFTADVVRWPERMKLGVAPHARYAASEFAGAKCTSWAENLVRYERAHEQGLDEVILLNERGEIAECTSANIFVADGGHVWTPPLASGCLAGVSRAILLEEVRVPGLSIGERPLRPTDLETASEIFISSTTRELLPVESVEGVRVRNGREVCGKLQSAFTACVEAYVGPRRQALAIS